MNPPQPTKTFKVDQLPIKIYKDADSLGKAAALEARRIIQEAIDERKKALFLEEHFLRHVNVERFFPIPGQPLDLEQACQEYTNLLMEYPADLVAMGWGENGHIAFNDPPFAEFNDPKWVKLIELAEASRKQQVNEGHFETLDQVPKQALTLTIPALIAPKRILCIVPEKRKARAVQECLEKPVGEDRPGSILRTVSHAELYLDQESSSYLN